MCAQWRKITTYDVFVGNIPKEATEKTLSKLFTCYGEIHGIVMKEGNRKDGTKIGFIKYYNEPDADEAVKERAGHMWDGLPLHVRRTNDKKEQRLDTEVHNDTAGRKRKNEKNPDSREDNGTNNSERKERLIVTHIEDPCTFYGQNADRIQELKEMSITINEFCSSAKPIQGKPIQHQMYATVFSLDNTWYRCTILQHITEEKSLVKYVDYGNAEIVENFKIIAIPENMASLPPLAKRYRLNRLQPRKDNKEEEGTKCLSEMIENKLIECKTFKNEKTNFIPIEIISNTMNVEDEIVRKGYAVRFTKGTVSKNGPDGSQSQIFNFDLNKTPGNNGKLPHPIRGRSSYSGNQMPVEFFEKTGGNHLPSYIERKNFTDIHRRLEQETTQKEIASLKSQIASYHNKIEQMTEQQTKMDFLGNVKKVCEDLQKVQQYRNQFPTGSDTCEELENAAKLLLDDNAHLLPQNLLHLPGVKQALNHYNNCQAQILECSESDEEVQKLIPQRDEARIALHEALIAFLNEMKELPLQNRLQELTKVINNLNTTFKSYLHVQTTGSVPLNSILEAYKKWKFENSCRFEVVRVETDKQHKIFLSKMQELTEALTLTTQMTSTPSSMPSDIFSCLEKLAEALKAEIKISDVEEIHSVAVISLLVRKLHTELTQECEYVEQLKQLEKEYCSLEATLRPWLTKIPNLDDLIDVRKKIKSLRSRLRHKLADLNDLEEDNDVDEAAVAVIKTELSEIRTNLQESFAAEDKLLADLSNIVRDHFPELATNYPELIMETQYNGLVKQGRELIQFDLEGISSKNSIWKTKLCGKNIVIKEYFLDSSLNKEVFINKIQNYSSLKCPYLTPIKGVFFSKTEREAYVQIPLCVSLFTMTNENDCSFETKIKFALDVAQALKKLHEINLVHGRLNPHSVLFTSENTPTLIPCSFNSSHIPTEKDEKKYKGLTFVAPEICFHSKEPSPSSDMFSYGCLLLWLLYPKMEFSMNYLNIPDLTTLKETTISPLLLSLLSEVPHSRPTADHILQSSDLFYSSEITENISDSALNELATDYPTEKEQNLLMSWNINEVFELQSQLDNTNSAGNISDDIRNLTFNDQECNIQDGGVNETPVVDEF